MIHCKLPTYTKLALALSVTTFDLVAYLVGIFVGTPATAYLMAICDVSMTTPALALFMTANAFAIGWMIALLTTCRRNAWILFEMKKRADYNVSADVLNDFVVKGTLDISGQNTEHEVPLPWMAISIFKGMNAA